MANVNNREVLDQIINILSDQYRQTLRNSYGKNGLNFRGSVDFSGLKEQLMASIENGDMSRVESVINTFVQGKIQDFDTKAGEIMTKNGYAGVHRKIIDDLMGFSQKINRQCADAISKKVVVPEKTQGQSFRESLQNFQSNSEQHNAVSQEEALLRSAQTVYEKTGNVPDGYSLNEDGKIIRDETVTKTQQVDTPEISNDDVEIEDK